MSRPSEYAVVMAGGRGQRFWPQSRERRPKQLLPIVADATMLELALRRLFPLFDPGRVVIVTNRAYEEDVRRLAGAVPRENVIGEPMGRDTCACIALATAWIAARDPDAVTAVLPADQVVHDEAGFQATFRDALAYAGASGDLVTVGIRPTHPATGYGYIEQGAPIAGGTAGGTALYRVARFTEKPGIEVARAYLESGRHWWNTGMFAWSVQTFRQALLQYAPQLAQACDSMRDAARAAPERAAFLARVAELYAALPRVSVDFALLERASNVAMAVAQFDWDDVGSVVAVERHLPADAAGNVARGGPWKGLDTAGSIVIGSPDHLIATVGVRDLVIVHTADATLVCTKGQAERLKELLEALRADPELRHWT